MAQVFESESSAQAEVRRLVKEGSGSGNWICVPMYQEVVPDTSYATCLLISTIRRGWASIETVKGTNDAGQPTRQYKSVSRRLATYSIQWIGKGAGDAAERFLLWVESPDGQEEQLKVGVAYVGNNGIRDLSHLLQERKWESRVECEIEVLYLMTQKTSAVSVRYPVNSVEVNITGPNDDLEQTFEVPDS